MEKATKAEEDAALGSGLILFSGKPPFLKGTVSMVNRSDKKVKVRSLEIGAPGLESPGMRRRRRGPADATLEAESLPVRVFRRLDPDDQTDARAQLTVDRFTPPGEYEAEVRFGEEQTKALVFVLENHKLRLVPDRLTITGTSGQKFTRTVYITNEGNVPFNTRKAAFAPLEAANMVHRSLAIALNDAGKEGHEKFLDRFLSELDDNLVQPAKIKVDVQDEVIAPGETKRVEITIALPAGLKKRQVYRSKIRFRDAALALEVDVNGPPAI